LGRKGSGERPDLGWQYGQSHWWGGGRLVEAGLPAERRAAGQVKGGELAGGKGREHSLEAVRGEERGWPRGVLRGDMEEAEEKSEDSWEELRGESVARPKRAGGDRGGGSAQAKGGPVSKELPSLG
jgi:hypothetical protein